MGGQEQWWDPMGEGGEGLKGGDGQRGDGDRKGRRKGKGWESQHAVWVRGEAGRVPNQNPGSGGSFEQIELVDAEVYHEELKGKLAPKPGVENRGQRYVVGELRHDDLDFPYECGICDRKGHHWMECGFPGRLEKVVRRSGGDKDILTYNYLFEKGLVDKKGKIRN